MKHQMRCETHGKVEFASKEDAKRLMRKANFKRMHPYLCSETGSWHIGHLPRDIRFGATDRNSDQVSFTPGLSQVRNKQVPGIVLDLVRNELNWKPRLAEVGGRITSHIAYIQRVEERSPSVQELMEALPDEYVEYLSEPDETWKGGPDTWVHDIKLTTILQLAVRGLITISPCSTEVRIRSVEKIAA